MADYLDKNTSAAIGGDVDGSGSRRGMPRLSARMSPGQPLVHLPGDNEEEVVNPRAIDYTAPLNFDNYDNNGDNDDGNNDNDVGAGGGEPRGTNKEDQEEEMGEAEEERWARLSKKRKSEMNKDELFAHFEARWRGGIKCPNLRCDCLAILDNVNARASIVKYLCCWFFQKSKYKQDSIVFK
jgi:hypothetical protein